MMKVFRQAKNRMVEKVRLFMTRLVLATMVPPQKAGQRGLDVEPWVMVIIGLFLIITLAVLFLPAVRSFIMDTWNNLTQQILQVE